MHYFKHNIGDHAIRRGRLTILQEGAYFRLVEACYQKEAFPVSEEEAIDWAWAQPGDEEAAVKYVLKRMFERVDGAYVTQFIADDIAKYQTTSAANKRVAEEREAKRKASKEAASPVSTGAPTRIVNESTTLEHESPPNQELRTNNQEPLTINQTTTTGVCEISPTRADDKAHMPLANELGTEHRLCKAMVKAMTARRARGDERIYTGRLKQEQWNRCEYNLSEQLSDHTHGAIEDHLDFMLTDKLAAMEGEDKITLNHIAMTFSDGCVSL